MDGDFAAVQADWGREEHYFAEGAIRTNGGSEFTVPAEVAEFLIFKGK
jgi:hypothetical protein